MVFAQGNTSFYGGGMRGMMNNCFSWYAGHSDDSGNGTYGPGMMGNTNDNGIGMMSNTNGNGMMSNGNREKMRDAMNTGNWDEMANVCKDTINSQTTLRPSSSAVLRKWRPKRPTRAAYESSRRADGGATICSRQPG